MRHLYIPDTQIKPDDRIDHLRWAGMYAVDTQPEKIIFGGDHWDMPSLCTYDYGTKGFEGRSYLADIQAGNQALAEFMMPIRAEQAMQRRKKKKVWNPSLWITLGNHEYRIERAINADRKLDGLLTYDDFNLEEYGFTVAPYLEVVVLDGVAYSHFFTSGVMGRPVSSARLMLNKKHMSCVMGHVQDRDIAFAKRADGTQMTGIFGGIFYQGDQDYLTAQTNDSWKGIWMFNDVQDGAFDEMPISLNYLRGKYNAK